MLCWVLAAVSSQTAAWELTAAPDLETKLMGEATAVVACMFITREQTVSVCD